MDNRKLPNSETDPQLDALADQGWDAMRQMLDLHMPLKDEEEDTPVIPLFRRWMAAAVILLLVGVGGYFYFSENSKRNSDIQDIAVNKEKIKKDQNINSGLVANRKAADNASIVKTTAKNSHSTNSISSPSQTIVSAKKEIHSRSHLDNVVDKVDRVNIPVLALNNHETSTPKSIATKNNAVAVVTASGLSGLSHEWSRSANDVALNNKTISIATIPNVKKENNSNSVEGNSLFRKEINEALKEDFKTDSLHQRELAIRKKNLSDSQLTASRKEQLVHFFEKAQKDDSATATHSKPKVDLAVLVNRNMVDKNINPNGSSIYNLPIYPAVNASIRISNKIGITTGISTASPGNFTNTSLNGPVMMSSPAYSNILNVNSQPISKNEKAFLTSNSFAAKEVVLSSEVNNQVQQAYYWQIPLLFDYYVMHTKLKISAGTDFSIIQRVLVGNNYSTQLMSGGDYNNSGGVYQVRHFDPRLSVGAQYRINNFLLGARFSRSFQPAIQYNGLPTNGGNNQVFNISIGYSFFK